MATVWKGVLLDPSGLECPREASRKLMCTSVSAHHRAVEVSRILSEQAFSSPLLPSASPIMKIPSYCQYLDSFSPSVKPLSSQALWVLDYGQLVFCILKEVWTVLPAAFQVHRHSLIHWIVIYCRCLSWARCGTKFREQQPIQPYPPQILPPEWGLMWVVTTAGLGNQQQQLLTRIFLVLLKKEVESCFLFHFPMAKWNLILLWAVNL